MHKAHTGLQSAITHLLLAVPDPTWWSGPAATACARKIESVVDELRALEVRLVSGWLTHDR